MGRLIDADGLARHLREISHFGKAAAIVERYAADHAVDAVAIGEPVSLDGLDVRITRDNTMTVLKRGTT